MNPDLPAVTDPLAHQLLTHLDHWSREVSFQPEKTIASVSAGEPPLGSFRALLGRDKTWLVVLSSPVITADAAGQIAATLQWTIDAGLHDLYNKQLRAGAPVESGPRTELVNSASLDTQPSTLYDDNLLDSPTFSAELERLLEWKNKQHPGLIEYPGGTTLNTIGVYIAEHSSLPEPAARLLFSGVPNTGNRYDINFDKALLKRIGLTPGQAATAEWFYSPNGLEPVRELLLGLTWHPEFFTEGPHLGSFVDWWSRRYGPKWIHLTNDEFWDLLTTAETAYGGYGEIESIRSTLRYPGKRVDAAPWNLTTLLNLAMYVVPQSPQALAIAHALEHHAVKPTALPDVVVEVYEDTTDFTDPRLRPTTKIMDSWVVSNGYIDEWFGWLRHGTNADLTSRDPRISAPQAVATVRRRHDVSEDAACYYLQLLVLTVPKDVWIRRWNGWSTARLKEAAAELVHAGLVVQDKRPGAGRTVFVPGRWHKRSDTGPAMEEQKLDLYMAWKSVASRPLINGAPPLRPLGLLFAEVAVLDT